MKAASIIELKQELQNTAPKKVLDLCLRLARFKKENKELLTYLLFEAHDEQGYMQSVKNEIDEQFTELPKSTLYLTKKSLRKILRATNKYIRYTGSKQVEAELLIYFCSVLKASGIPIHKTAALTGLYDQQLKKINTAVAALHEDLQYDYLQQVKALQMEKKTIKEKILSTFKKLGHE